MMHSPVKFGFRGQNSRSANMGFNSKHNIKDIKLSQIKLNQIKANYILKFREKSVVQPRGITISFENVLTNSFCNYSYF